VDDREELVEKAPLWLLRPFGVTGKLSALLWQVECKVRQPCNRDNVGDREQAEKRKLECKRQHGRMGELRRLPTHLRVLVNLACSTEVVDENVVRSERKLRVLHWLLLNVTSSFGEAMKTLCKWCVGPQAVRCGQAPQMREVNRTGPITRLEQQLEETSMEDVVRAVVARRQPVSMRFDLGESPLGHESDAKLDFGLSSLWGTPVNSGAKCEVAQQQPRFDASRGLGQ